MPDTALLRGLLLLEFLPLLAAFLWLGLRLLLSRPPSERAAVAVARLSLAAGLLASLGLGGLLLREGARALPLGAWFSLGSYRYELVALIDGVSLSYAAFSCLFLYLISSFSQRYLHKEPGYHRFYLILLLFALGLQTVSFAGTLELLLVGWELVGLASVLLISFFTLRPKPARNAFWAFCVYRLSDVGLYAAVLLLHGAGLGTLFVAQESAPWFGLAAPLALPLVGGLLFLAVSGKSALFPFCGWLPRAMEGPTPSSAVFYGALSVHLGPLLLLRSADLVAATPLLAALLVGVGLLSAALGLLCGRVQTDIKSRLAFGSVAQLGFIVAEIGLGWTLLALLHVVAHAVFRTLQILRAPSLLQERQQLEQMLGHRLSTFDPGTPAASAVRRWLYRFALERAYLDPLLLRAVDPPLRLARWLDRRDRALADKLEGR